MVARSRVVPPLFVGLVSVFVLPDAPLAPTRHLDVGVLVTPSNGTDPTLRVANTTGNQVTFSVKNIGSVDTRFSGTCTPTGAVTSVSCTSIGILIPQQTKIVTATFATGSAGTGTIRLDVTSTSPTGASGTGIWNETVVNPAASVTPDGAAVTLPPSIPSSYEFTVTNTGTARTTYTAVAVCSGAGASGCSPSPTSLALDPSTAGPVRVSFSTGAGGSTGLVELQAQVGGAVIDRGTVNVTVVTYGVAVTPDGATAPARAANTSGHSEGFNVQNTGTAENVYSLLCGGSANVTCTGMTIGGVSVTSVTLAGGATTTVTAHYSVGEVGTGTLTLAASGTNASDGGSYSVPVVVASAQAPVVDVSTVNPGAVIERGACLIIAVSAAAAAECGDLRIIHALPAVRTMNKARTPTLLYNSQTAHPYPLVAANVTLPSAAAVPDSVTGTLTIGGVTRAREKWVGSQWVPGQTRRVVLGFEGLNDATGIYSYTLEVRNWYPDPTPSQPTTVNGQVAVVNRSTSPFGAGWWLAGLEQLNVATMKWVGGDGSVRQYTLAPGSVAPNRVWGTPSVTYADSIRESGTEYVRQLPDSIWVFFDAQGRHVRTRNRQGHVTTFAYDPATGKLTTITVPPAASPLSYNVNYDANGRISTIVAPGVPLSRTTTLTIDPATGRLTSILEPDGRTVGFGYSGDHKIRSRTDRRSTVTEFQYDAGGRVSQATINLVPGTITRTLQQASSQGFAGTSVPLSQVFTRLDGPRPVNTTSFYLNRFGAPDTIIDALGQRTRLVRGDTRFLGLVTQLTTVTGHTITATYDERGRILTSSEPSTSGQMATTTYQWDPKWDQVTRITNPEGDFMEFGVDAVTGNRIWQQDGRGLLTRTRFEYYPDNQLLANLIPPNSGFHSYDYDDKGNLEWYSSAMDVGFFWTSNAIGLTTEVRTPTGPCCQPNWPPHQIETIAYSVRNEDTLRVVSLSGQSTTVKKKYDQEGNLDTLTRTFFPNPRGISSLVTSWQYDRANRPTRQTEPDNTFGRRWFDAAGNLDSVSTRRGLKIAMTYDSLNRLRTRTLPPVAFSLPASQIYPATPVDTLAYSYAWSADTQSFRYAPNGQVSRASNKDATVARMFAANGALLAETLYIKRTDRTASHSYTTTYAYDRNGRRTSLTAPSLFTGGPIGYGYDTQWGALTSVTDIGGNTFSFLYNERSELTRTLYGGGISQYLGYDGDGRLSSDSIINGLGQTFPRFPGPKLRNFVVGNRNARGQILSSTESVLTDRVNATYSGLGYLEASHLRERLVNAVTGGPVDYASTDTTIYDGLGNILAEAFWDSVYVGQWDVTRRVTWNAYTPVGRLEARSVQYTAPGSSFCCENTTYSYDAAGNNYFEAMKPGINVTTERAAYHGPDEKLLATDTRATGRRTFEEYRYDALGRRVWVRSVTTCEPTNAIECVTPYARRTIWDGVQELAEIQAPVDPGDPADGGHPPNPELEEMDTLGILFQSYNPAAGAYGDPNPWYGRVVYGPGVAVDQPLSVTRYDYRDSPGSGAQSLSWPRFTWQIYWNYQGLPTYGTLTTGAWAYPYQLGQGQTSCPVLGNQTTQRCVIVRWPLAHSAYDQNRGKVQYLSWHGSLLEGKRDRSGLEYKRNRQYDPQTGRFTQEDPIGLAGGLNPYGFASGDPINFGDPFGLKPCKVQTPFGTEIVDDRIAQAFVNALAEAIMNGYNGDVNATFRTEEEQQAEVDAGRTTTQPGESAHEAGTAVDTDWQDVGGKQQVAVQGGMNTYGFEQTYSGRHHFEHRLTRGKPDAKHEMIEEARSAVGAAGGSKDNLPACAMASTLTQ